MTKNLSRWAAGAIGAAATLLATSCAYDPSYSSGGGGSYAYDSYGDGYGYGGSSFSTSIFVGTGDPRWGYDPYTYSYYDYTRRAYYDPYLYGYYPVGYRPRPVYGVPHPGGWRPGRGYCPPPSRVRSQNLSNYRNRESAYRGTNYSWANQVRARDGGGPSSSRNDSRPGQGGYDRSRGNDSPSRSQWNGSGGGNFTGNTQRDGSVRYGGERGNSSTRSSYGADQSPARSARQDYDRSDSQQRQNRYQPQQNSGQPERSSRPQRDGNFTPSPSQGGGGRRPSPSGYNSPVGISPGVPQQQRSAPQQRIAPPQQQSQPQGRQFQGGANSRRSAPPAASSNNGGNGDGRRDRR